MTERPTAKAVRDSFEAPTVWGVVEAEPIRLDQPPEPAHSHGVTALRERFVAVLRHARRVA